VDDVSWGADATDWAQAVTTGMLQKAGGLFQLLAEADFGTTYGLKSVYFKSRSADVASTGQIRLSFSDLVNWRNEANDADLSLAIGAGDILTFDGAGISIGGDPVQTEITVADTSTIDLTLAGSNLSADVRSDSILNSMINASAAIDFSKLAALTAGYLLIGSVANVATAVAMSGDVTISSVGVTSIGANKVTNAMLAQVATATIKGRTTAGTGDVEDLTGAQATALLSNFVGDSGSGGTKGLVPAPAAGDAASNKYLAADGTWTSPTGAGDVVGPASSTNNGFARLNGTTGKTIKDSPATIVNADVDSAAAIAFSKLATLNFGSIVAGNGSNVAAALSGNQTATHMYLRSYGNGLAVTQFAWVQIDFSELSGSLAANAVTTTSITNNNVTNAKLAQMATNTIKGNNTGGTANAADLTVPQVAAMFTSPTIQKFTSGSGTYTTPANCKWIRVRAVGAGGGGGGSGGSGTGASTGATGGTTTFGSSLITCVGGAGGSVYNIGGGGAGGSATATGLTGVVAPGGSGQSGFGSGAASQIMIGGMGSASPMGGAGGGSGSTGTAAIVNSGSGGGGAGVVGVSTFTGGGGGAGGYVDVVINSPSSTYAYAVGASGAGGGAAVGGAPGGASGSGCIIVEEFYV